jgi:HK97 gp10 family phage protein
MSGLTVEIKGVDEAVLKFNRFDTVVADRVRAVVKDIAHDIERGAKQKCPVDTGRLRASITTQLSSDGFGAEIGTNVDYAEYVEFGTVKMEAQPYLFPSLEEQRTHYENQMKAAVKASAENPYKL